MHCAILAGGAGSRLRCDGVDMPKPLVSLDGLPMVDRLIDMMVAAGASQVTILVNIAMGEVVDHLRTLKCSVPIDVVTASTPSSMHSLAELASRLRGAPFCLTTVDTIFEFGSFVDLLAEARWRLAKGALAVMGVTSYVDDEKPLWVSCDSARHIVDFLDHSDDAPFVSAGVYCLGDEALEVLDRCLSDGVSRMRNFQRRLLEHRADAVYAVDMGKVMDVDHASDLEAAAAFVSDSSHVVLGVERATRFSVNSEAKDRAIYEEVVDLFRRRGYTAIECGEDHLTPEVVRLSDHVFTMGRDKAALHILKEYVRSDVRVVNTVESLLRRDRWTHYRLLCDASVAMPRSVVVACDSPGVLPFVGWLKRIDGVSEAAEDVRFVDSDKALKCACAQYLARGFGQVLLMKHVEGFEVKCYGIGDHCFSWRYTDPKEDRRFSGKRALDLPERPLDELALKMFVAHAAHVVGLSVYGADVIVTDSDRFVLIDMNDFPSFSGRVESAAEAIVYNIIGNG